jgi:hypothetical protein
VLLVTVQVQSAAHDHDPAVNALTRDTRWRNADVFAFHIVGEGNRRFARVGPGFGADFQFPVQHDPLGGQLKVLVVCEAESAVDRHTAERRRTDVENDIFIRCNSDLVACEGHLSVRPGGRIRPTRRLGGRRPSFLSLNDSECADDQECWKERSKKERAMSLTHGINLRTRS